MDCDGDLAAAAAAVFLNIFLLDSFLICVSHAK